MANLRYEEKQDPLHKFCFKVEHVQMVVKNDDGCDVYLLARSQPVHISENYEEAIKKLLPL